MYKSENVSTGAQIQGHGGVLYNKYNRCNHALLTTLLSATPDSVAKVQIPKVTGLTFHGTVGRFKFGAFCRPRIF